MKRLWSTDFKQVGIHYIVTGSLFLALGGLLALMMRWQLGFPGRAFPGCRPMTPDFYNMLFTMHGTIMMFFAVVPILWNGFGSYLVPLQIGADTMAFPKLHRLSYLLYLVAGLLLISSWFVPGGAPRTGWSAYTPLSVYETSGQTWWILSLCLLSVSSLLASVNLVTTVLYFRAPNVPFFSLPMTVWGMWIAALMILFAFPALLVAGVCLLSDRLWATHFFLSRGGQPLLWQHLFWFFGHPEVYVLILPVMGMVSDIFPVFADKPLFGYRSMVYALLAIAGLGFVVWGHHMFVTGMNPVLGATFMLSTLVIAVPSAVKTFNWIATLWGGRLRFPSPMWAALGFLSLFIFGGLTGILLALAPTDMMLHNTAFVVGHFHLIMAGGALFGFYAGIYFWFPRFTGRILRENLAKIHLLWTWIFFLGVMTPLLVLGMAGEPRRLFNTFSYPALAALQPIRTFSTICAFLLIGGQALFLWNVLWSYFRGQPAPANPWNAKTREWQ